MIRRFIPLLLLTALASPSWAVSLTMSVAGDSVFFAPQGDTVTVEVFLDSEGESLTGVELFLGFDPTLFSAVDAGAPPGSQPAVTDSLLGEVLADSLLTVSDSLSLIHFAEADLGGDVVDGRLFTFRVTVAGWLSGTSAIAVYQSSETFRTSAYTVDNDDGTTVTWEGVPPVTFRDLPPELTAPPPFVMVEDDTLSVRIDTLAADEAVSFLAWTLEADSAGSVVAAVAANGDSALALFEPSMDFNGTVPIVMTATDPGGGSVSVTTSLQVLPVNDPPLIAGSDSLTVALTSSDTVRLVPFPEATDVDDAEETLVWEVEGGEGVTVGLVTEGVQIDAPSDWAGETSFQLQLVDPKGLSDVLTVVVTRAASSGKLGDFDSDNDVDFSDFLLFAGAFGKPDADPLFDLDGDGSVDFADFLVFAGAFGK